MVQPERSNYLQEVDDGLPMREGQSYAKTKLNVVKLYLGMAMKAVKKKPWRTTHYIDLQAGPGKNNLEGTIALGSPLIALTCPVPFQHYLFNEKDPELAQALQTRAMASPLWERTKILQMDANDAVVDFCGKIEQTDKQFMSGQYSSFNIAFLDPEGLEIHWSTVKRLASMNLMDLIINFSTGGLNRTLSTSPEAGDRFFGTDEWRRIVPNNANATTKRRAWINLYLSRLSDLGYSYQIDDGSAEVVAKNVKNVQVYSIISASKDALGLQLWKKAVKLAQQPRLFE